LFKIQRLIEQVVVHPWLYRWVRLGFAAKGTVYLAIGLIAARATIGAQGRVAGTYQALVKIKTQPLGQFLLCILAVGLAGYVLWRFVQATIDPEHTGKLSRKRVLQRVAYLINGMGYAGVAYTAVETVTGSAESSDTIEDLTAELIEHHPLGAWLVCLGGIGVVGVGISYLYGAYTAAAISEFNSAAMPSKLEDWAIRIGKLGMAARGFSFVLIGIFLVRAALLLSSDPVGGLVGILEILEQRPLGSLWLGLIAFGFIAYALYMLLAAWYRRFLSK